MTQPSLPTRSSGLRVFSACLLSALMIMMPFVQLASAEQRSLTRSQRSEPQGENPKDQSSNATAENLFVNPAAAVGITATKSDAFPVHPSGKAEPGDTITYTVDVSNPNPVGTDATNVTFQDIIDANTTRFGADFDLKVSPLAINDTYAAIQNTPLVVAAPGVLTNDTGVPAPTAVPIAAGPTTQGGTVTLNADGSFTYNPPNASFTGADTFTYTATNGQTAPNPGVDDVATVTINVDAAPTVQSTTPADNAVNQATDTNITITFSEPVNVTGTWFTISCSVSGSHTAAVTGGPTTYTLNPNTDFTESETCTVTVVAAQVTDVDSNDPPDNMVADYVFDFTMDAAPTVSSTTPTNGATNIATNSNIVVNFSESVSLGATPVTISCATSGAHTSVVSASPNTTFTVNPDVDFAQNELCTVTVVAAQVSDTDANDPPNNMVADYVFSFTTDAAPTVTATTPTNGATNQTSNTDITLTFSESVSLTAAPVTISCTVSGAHNAYTVSASPNTVFTINPNVDFTAGETCTVTVLANQVSDTDGGDPPDNMAANFVFSFSIDAAPTVNATTPANGATQVANNTNISITFSESVNLGATPVTISCVTSGAHTSVVSASPNTVFTVNPDTDFTNGELCTVTVLAAQVTDNDANDPPDNMAADFVFSFTIDNPPSVTTTVPANNATDIAQSSTITINFSEPVNVAAGGVTINCGSAVAFTPALPQNNTSSLVLTPTGGLPAGTDCTVTVLAANVTDVDTGDPPDNMVTDHVFSFKVKPDAVNDNVQTATGQTVLGNVNFTSANIPYSVTTNDVSANAFTVTAFDAASANGGTVSVAANGQFTYNPPRGFEGSDTFNYTISRTDGGGTDTAQVTITVSGMIWFINNNAGACTVSCDGRLTNPYTTLAAFNTANGLAGGLDPADNDNIFVYESATAYTGAVTLRSGQKLIGQDGTGTLYSITGLTQYTGHATLPGMNAGGNTTNITSTVTMHNSTTVRGLSINATGTSSGLVASSRTGLVVTEVATISAVNTPGVAASFTSSSGTFTFTNISASGTAAGLNFASTTSASLVSINNITTTSGAAMTLSSTGATDFTVNDVTSTTGTAVSVTTSTGDFIFHAINANGAAKGITVTSATGTFTVNGTGTTDGSGGTVQNCTSRGAEFISSNNILVKNMNFTNNGVGGSDLNCGDALGATTNSTFTTSAACESNIHLVTVTTATLNNVNANDGDAHGIAGIAVNGLTLTDVNVERNGNEVGEDGVQLVNSSGTVTLSGANFFRDNASNQFEAQNGSGSVIFSITGGFFGLTNFPTTGAAEAPSPGSSTANSGLLISASGTASMTPTVTGSTFEENYANGYLSDTAGSATMNITLGTAVSGNTFTNNGVPIEIVNASTGSMTYIIRNNTITNNTAITGAFATTAIVAARSGAGSVMTGTIDDNIIGTAGVQDSGCFVSACDGISLPDSATSSTNAYHVNVTNNVINQVDGGITSNIGGGDGSPKTSFVITGNTIGNPNTATQANALLINSGTLPTSTPQTCVEISGNTFNGAWSSLNGDSLRLRHRGAAGSTFRIRNWDTTINYDGIAPTGDAADAMRFLENNNTFSGHTDKTGFQLVGANVFTGGTAACPLLLAEGGIEGALGPQTITAALEQHQLDLVVEAAKARWLSSGLTAQQLKAMNSLRFEIGNLGQAYLGEADGNRIVVDRDAQGKGWFIDTTPADDLEFGDRSSATRRYTNPYTAAAGRVDLLTAIEHEIGHKLGLDDSYAEKDRDSIMYGYLTVGERRMPAKGEAANAQAGSLTGTHFLKLKRAEGSKQKAISRKNHAATTRALAPVSGETLNYTIGTLPGGKKVRLTFKVTIDIGFTGTQVSNQGTVNGSINSIPFSAVLTDDPDTGTAGDATITPVQGPPNAVDDAYTAFKNTPLNVAAPGVLTNDANVTSVTAVNGSGANVGIATATTPAATGTVTVNADGSFTYTPPNATFTGTASFTYEATGTSADTATVTITVVDTSAIFINEVLFDPPGGDAPNEYIELRGPASTTIPAGTYLVAIEGDAADNPGDVKTIINLSGLSFGTNGYLVLLQMSNVYVPAAGANVLTSTTVGFGGLPGGIWSADASATDLPDASVTFMLIQTGTAPTLTDDPDAGNDGGLTGPIADGWSVRDSVGVLDNSPAGDFAYGAINFADNTGAGVGTGTTVSVGFTPTYVGRICDSTGSTAADWLSSGALGGIAPNWTLGSSPEPPTFAGNPLDHLGTTNFINNAPANTVPGAQATNEDTALTFNAGNSNLISIADSDAGNNNVQVTLTATNGVVSLSGTAGLSFSFSDGNGTGAGDGTADTTMTFRGTVSAINTALDGMTFTPTSNYSGAASVQIVTNDLGSTGGAGCSTVQTDTDSVSITVNGINDAPVLDNTGNMTLNPIPQDISAVSNTGTLVSDIIASAGGDRITDADAGAVEGLAVITVDNTNGTWEYSTTGSGGPWTAFGSPTNASARLLAADANTRIRFQPNVGFNGTRTITFRAWDQTTGSNGGTGDATTNGGATAFSTATETASITVSSNINIQDAKVAEPASGTIDMVFTVSLAAPAPGPISVNFTTQDEPAGPGKAVAGTCGAGGDYSSTNGIVSFAAGEQVKTINVPVCSDNTSEPDETFLVVLSGATGASIADGTATGTILAANTAGTLLISELRTSGPAGAGDDFVEIYNNTNSVHTVPAGGYGLFKMGSDCNATPVLIGTIPAGTNIPAHGHFLFVGSAYSLANYGGTAAAAGDIGGTLTADIENDRNVALFSTTDVGAISSVNRFDAVGFGLNIGSNCNLLREGSTLPAMSGSVLEYSFFRKMCDWVQGQGCTVPGVPKDTNQNADDFWLADTTGSVTTGRLGAPGPENLGSPIRRDNTGINMGLLDSTAPSSSGANRDRNGTAEPNATFGTMTLRYRVTNNTGAPVTRLRYRIVDISTAIQPPGPTADLRALTGVNETSVGPVGDPVTCAGPTPCNVFVNLTTLEQPPTQNNGGGYNATLSSGTITTGTPLNNGQFILVNFKLGVQQAGTFRFYIIIEALP